MPTNTFEELLALAKQSVVKRAAVDAATLQAMSGGGMDPAAAGMDPAAMGMGPAAMGMDPAAMGMDPAAMGMDPAAGGGASAGPDPLEQRIAALEAQLAASGGAGGAAPTIKPKIDINVEMMQVKKMLAKLLDAAGVAIPASDMVATPDDLMQMANQQQAGGSSPASAIQPPQPIGAASPSLGKSGAHEAGYAFDMPQSGFGNISSRAAALGTMMSMRKKL